MSALQPRPRASSATPDPLPPIEAWVTDRDAHAVIGLDSGLLIVKRVDLRFPIEVEARTDGGAWVVSSPDGDPIGAHRITRLDNNGAVRAQSQVGILLDLDTRDGAQALVVELVPGGANRVVQVTDDGSQTLLAEIDGARCVAGAVGEVLIGLESGVVARIDAGSASGPGRRRSVGGIIADVAAGPLPGKWWALDIHGTGRLLLLDSRLAIEWSVPLSMHALHLAPVPGEERVWIADTTQPFVRRFGPHGAIELENGAIPLSGLDRCTPWRGGGALFAAPGAIVHLDSQAQVAPGQGGFQFLVDVDRVP